MVGQRKGPSWANAPPVHGIKKCIENVPSLASYSVMFNVVSGELCSNMSSCCVEILSCTSLSLGLYFKNIVFDIVHC